MANELEGKRIFIVEDNPMNMAVNTASLKHSGAIIIQDPWQTTTVTQVVQRLPIDVVLLDLMLHHDMSGYDTFDQIKAHPKLAHIPIIAVSAADPGIEIPRTQEKGFAGFIGKPVKPHWFAKQIASCIRGEAIWYAQIGTMEYF
jgi:CheY-like chemotaxis protein